MVKVKEDAIKELTPYLEFLRSTLSEANESYKNLSAETRRVHSPRTRSSNIADYIKDYVLKKLYENPHIRVILKYGTIRILIDDKYQFTFKKLSRNLRPSYIPTQRQFEFYNQVTFEGMPEQVTNVTAGYQWVPVSESKYYLVCLNGDEVSWQVELNEPTNTDIENTNEGVPSLPQNSLKRVFPKTK